MNIEIKYQPYVGLLYENKPVHTKIKDDKKLHFFQFDNGNISMDDFDKSVVDELIEKKIVKYLGWVELKE
jgi:hypothetical protein